MMNPRFHLVILLLLTGLTVATFGGCSSSSDSVASQTIDDFAWLPNGSGMLAMIDQLTISAIDGSAYETANLYNVGADGSVGNSINAQNTAPNASGYTPMVFISQDGQTAITQFSNDIYRVDVSSGNITDIIQNANLLGVSPGMEYALTTAASEQQTAKILSIYNISTPTPKLLLPRQTVVGVVSTKALWTDDAHFALAMADSVGADNAPYYHVAIFDTTGTVTQIIPNASVGLNTGAYASQSGDLFFLNHALGIDKFNLTTKTRASVVANDSVESFDVSSDGRLLVYSSQEFAQQFQGYVVNVSDGNKTNIASGMVAPIISPDAHKVAFIHELSGESSDIQVVPVSLPN